MKRNFKFLSIMVCFTIVFSCLTFIKPNLSNAWSTTESTISRVVVKDGIFKSFNIEFTVPGIEDNFGEATSWIGIQTKQFNEGNQAIYEYGDLTDFGTVYKKHYNNLNILKNDNDFTAEYGVQGFSADDGFLSFGNYTNINTSISGLNIPVDNNQTYYVYLWTKDNYYFYPDARVATFTVNNGTIEASDSAGNDINLDGKIKDTEIDIIDKIEIIDSNDSLKVGEKPTFTAKIKDNNYNIKLTETLLSTPDQSSSITSDENDIYSDKDGLVKNLIYDYMIELEIDENNDNLKFDYDNMKIILNGSEFNDFGFTGKNLIYVYKGNGITPEGYIKPATLDNDFEEKQIMDVEKIVLKDVKAGKVKYKDYFDFTAQETKDAIEQAIANGSVINVNIYISKTIHNSLITLNEYENTFDKNFIEVVNNKINESQKFGAYYEIIIEVYVDGYIAGFISELETPINITIPTPNGLPELKEGYQRVWKVVRDHDGTVEELNAKQTDDGICFTNDKFSGFATLYEDIGPEDKTEVKTEETTNPKTGDEISTWIYIAIISIVLVSGILIYKKAI